jgi:hypothetical protein
MREESCDLGGAFSAEMPFGTGETKDVRLEWLVYVHSMPITNWSTIVQGAYKIPGCGGIKARLQICLIAGAEKRYLRAWFL